MRFNVTEIRNGRILGILHRPEVTTGPALILTHGTTSNSRAPLLQGIAKVCASRGLVVLCCDLPRTQDPGYTDDLEGEADDRAILAEAADWMRTLSLGQVIVGGQSYGARQSSLLAASVADCVDALLLLAYPLRPPSLPGVVRIDHLTDIHVPTLFLHGTRDRYGSVAQIQAAAALIPAPTAVIAVEGAQHNIQVGAVEVVADILVPLGTLFRRANMPGLIGAAVT